MFIFDAYLLSMYNINSKSGFSHHQHRFVTGPPIPDILACHQDNFIQVALFLQSINLTSCVRARPRPYVTWQRCADEVMNQTLNEFYVTYDDVRGILSTVLVVYVRSPETYGNYRVTFENEYGTLYQNFTLQAKRKQFMLV